MVERDKYGRTPADILLRMDDRCLCCDEQCDDETCTCTDVTYSDIVWALNASVAQNSALRKEVDGIRRERDKMIMELFISYHVGDYTKAIEAAEAAAGLDVEENSEQEFIAACPGWKAESVEP